MLILEKPYVSDLLAKCAVEHKLPVLRNEMSDRLAKKGYALSLFDDDQFEKAYHEKGRLYTMSENALEWLYRRLPKSEIVEKIELLKNKADFRRICSDIYPDFFFKELSITDLYSFPAEELKFPVVIKPTVGFLSAGVYVVWNVEDWRDAIEDIKANFEKVSSQFPDFVVGSASFLIEEYIKGDEFAVDAYFDEKGEPVILNIFHHRFASEKDVSDRLYCTSKAIYDQYYTKFVDFLTKINSAIKLCNFPMHIEFRYDGKKAIPIEINPLRFAGFCLNEIQFFISGIHPVLAYLDNIHPNYDEMWKGRETDIYSFLVFERPAGLPVQSRLDEAKLKSMFSNVLDLRPVSEASVGVFATMFSKTDKNHVDELDRALILNMKDFCMK